MKDKLFDVVIFHMESCRVESVIGKDLTERQADKREMTGYNRINLDAYSVSIVPAGKYKVGDILSMKVVADNV